MNPTNRLALAERAMRDAPAHNIGEALRDILHAHYGAHETEVYLIDYHLTELRPLLGDGEPGVAITGTSAGFAFAHQSTVERDEGEGVAVYLPVTIRGNRIGVVRAVLAERPDVDLCSELRDLAMAFGQALVVADVVTDRFREARRPQRLTLAAEMQWQLLPGRGLEHGEFTLAGQLEPAYAVCGDNFDWTADGQYLTVSVTNGMGESVDAALLSCLAIHALRNARRAGVGLADQAALADQAVWSQYGGGQHVATLLLRFDLDTGRVTAIDAGSPQIWLVRGIEVEQLELEAQLPLGMFDGTVYTEQEFMVKPGDRLFLLSDGVFNAVFEEKRYGEADLERMLRSTRSLSASEAIRALLSDLRVFRKDQDLEDDAVAVCLDWVGKNA